MKKMGRTRTVPTKVSDAHTGGFAVGLSSFALFLAYIFRIATVAGQTLAIGPFILRGLDVDSRAGNDG